MLHAFPFGGIAVWSMASHGVFIHWGRDFDICFNASLIPLPFVHSSCETLKHDDHYITLACLVLQKNMIHHDFPSFLYNVRHNFFFVLASVSAPLASFVIIFHISPQLCFEWKFRWHFGHLYNPPLARRPACTVYAPSYVRSVPCKRLVSVPP